MHSAKKILKNKNKKHPLPSAGVVALGKDVKKTDFFAECRGCCTRQRVFFKKKIRQRRPSADSVKSLPSARTALSKAFAECLKFGTRQSSLYRKGIQRRLFAECCTRPPSARTALGKFFAECPKFSTRQSSLYRKGIRRRLFAECRGVVGVFQAEL